ncbi:hypothetical protein PsorP6_016733 [Peronosclerospora sorghi]|uniref:Uncharacterized protein n=1 Tax=Peronosclerospora sorghi TaxID=230839 RepID=A0ACC0WD11_9STRA|nr:hypothetical protein PsorP6_016733 [Peronosclerospora sorghi]
MELMSSSEDEGDCHLPLSRSRHPSSPVSHDSLEDELLRPATWNNRLHNTVGTAIATRDNKPVISARAMLLNVVPSAKQPEMSTENAHEVEAAAASFDVSPTSKHEEKPMSNGERIARKYGLVAAAKLPPNEPAFATHATENEVASPVTKTQMDKTRKRLFWDAQTLSAATEEPTSSVAHISPLNNPDGFMSVKRRRQQRQQAAQKVSEDDMKRAREASFDDSNRKMQSVVQPPRHIIGSAIPEISDEADEWLSDSKIMELDDGNERVTIEKKPRVASYKQVSGQRNWTSSKKISRDETDDMDFSEDGTEPCMSEKWPRLDPPKINPGPMLLSSAEDENVKPFEVCANINSFLFDYQREGVKFLYSAYRRDTGVILGDDMGLGKTIQVIAFLSAILGKCGDHRDEQAWRTLLHHRRERYSNSGSSGDPEDSGFSFAGEVAPILIVVPASLLQNWEQELHTWMSCTTTILRGKRYNRDTMIDQIAKGEYEIVICSYDMLKMYVSRLHKIAWETVILDEMHCLKNPESLLTKAVKRIRCHRKLGLTGTLMQNNEKELHCLIDTIAPGAIGSWAEFSMYYGNDIKYGRKKSAVPEVLKRSRQKEKELRDKLQPYYLRREKQVNPTFQEVKKNDQVVFCDLTPLQMAAYERVMEMPEFQLLQRGDETCDCGRASKEKRKNCCYKTPMDIGDAPGLLYERFHDKEPCKNCPNCMGLPCVAMLLKLSNHLELLKVNPHDGSELQLHQAQFATAAFGDDLNAVGGVNQLTNFHKVCAISRKTCGKMIVLEKLLAVWKKRRERTLIFSRSTRMLDIILLFLISKAIKYSRLDGKTKVEERLQMVNDFNNPNSNMTVFLISTRAGGVGLNLQSATNVVIFDPSWNPAHDCQAQDRAYRIGQTKDVQVYRLITLGTIEEMIYVRQIYKQQLSDTTLKGANAPRYFEGVQGNPQERGELFGIANLICWKPGGVLKGIQDAYQRSRDGLLMQQNRVRYDAVSMTKLMKKSINRPSNVDHDEGEMIEVADELVSEVLIPRDAPQPVSPENCVDENSLSCEGDIALFKGATTFCHEEIVGEEESEPNGEQEICRLENDVVKDSDKPKAAASRSQSVENNTNDQPPLSSHPSPRKKPRSSILSRTKNATDSTNNPTTGPEVGKMLYVPAYL